MLLREAALCPIPDEHLYQPLFSPWLGHGDFLNFYNAIAPHSLVSPDRCYVLYQLARQAMHLPGSWYEAGVYKGGTAALLAKLKAVHHKTELPLRLFDTFGGMPATQPGVDLHQEGDFHDTSVDDVIRLLQRVAGPCGVVDFRKGLIPQTFAGLENDSVSLAHIDVDIYDSVMACCRFIWPRLVRGGFMIFDDYGFPSCPGARRAVDEYFQATTSFPLVLQTGQAIIFRSGSE
jgi:O-methyltransferase